MMSQFSLLAIAIVLYLPLGCLSLRRIEDAQCAAEFDRVGLPQQGINTYRAYKVPDPVAAGECNGLELSCEATIIPDNTLRGRTWFITNIRPNFGLYYDDDVVQEFRVQCPMDTFLHLYVQNSSLPGPVSSPNICPADSVRVQAEPFSGDGVTFCGNNDEFQMQPEFSDLYNNGRGRLIPDGKASISFCTDGVPDGPFNGFVMRASCLDPSEFQLPGCVDYNFFRAWDGAFVDLIFDMHPMVETVALPHKKRRSVSEAMARKRILRNKRFTGNRQSLELVGGDTVTYMNFELMITFNDTERLPITISNIMDLKAFNSLLGTREFWGSAPLTFNGPGILEYDNFFAILRNYIIPQDEIEATFLPGASEIEAANAVYEYIYNNWVFPYPVVDNIERRDNAPPIFPLPPGNMPPLFPDLDIDPYRPVNSLGFIQEDIQSGNDTGNCMRAIRIEVAPSIKGRVPDSVVRFCQFFDKACDLALKTACRELLRLDSLSVGK